MQKGGMPNEHPPLFIVRIENSDIKPHMAHTQEITLREVYNA